MEEKIQTKEKFFKKKIDISNLINEEARELKSFFDSTGYNLWIVGGAVRDYMLGLEFHDIDFTTDGTPEEILKYINNSKFSVQTIAKKYGCLIFIKNGKHFQVTTLRQDMKNYGRDVEVKFTDKINEDAIRRDFTINSLYLNFNGELYDPLDAYRDIVDRRIIFIGDVKKRIIEDHLRILRYLRFVAKFGYHAIMDKELQVCIDNKDLLLKLSKERVRDEILNFISCIKSKEIIEVLSIPTFFNVIGIKLNDFSHINRLHKIRECIEFDISVIFQFALALNKNQTIKDYEEIFESLKFSRKDSIFIREILDFRVYSKKEISQKINLLIYKHGIEISKYIIINSWIFDDDPSEFDNWSFLFKSIDNQTKMVFPIKPDHLMKIGISHGPDISRILKDLENIWINKNFKPSFKDLIKLVEQELPTDNRG